MTQLKEINCSLDPKNLSPIAYDIADQFDRVRTISPGKKIAIICGEDHGIATEVFIYAHIISALLAQQHEIVNITENPVDLLQSAAQKFFGLQLPNIDFQKFDKNGHLLLKSLVPNSPFWFNPEEFMPTKAHKYLIENNVTVIPADMPLAATKEAINKIMPDVIELAENTKEYTPGDGSQIDRMLSKALNMIALSQEGISTRDRHMALFAQQHDSVILNVGKFHVSGLTKLFNEKGYYTISVIPLSDKETISDISQENAVVADYTVTVKGHDQTRKKGNILSTQDEETHINEILTSSGSLISPAPLDTDTITKYAVEAGLKLERLCTTLGLDTEEFRILGQRLKTPTVR